MLVVSQNLSNYDLPIPKDTVYRINLAWVNNLDELRELLLKHNKQKIFLDLPINRTKPPSNNYSIKDLVPMIQSNPNIKYFAVSNVESKGDVEKYNEMLPKQITLVPKIESPNGVLNIEEIVNTIHGDDKIIMLDHDDLFSSILKQNEPPSKFKEHVNNLIEYCHQNNITLLRTVGVIFSDAEKRITQYIK